MFQVGIILIDKLEYYLAPENERIEIAKIGYERMYKDYQWEDRILKFLDWANTFPKRNDRV